MSFINIDIKYSALKVLKSTFWTVSGQAERIGLQRSLSWRSNKIQNYDLYDIQIGFDSLLFHVVYLIFFLLDSHIEHFCINLKILQSCIIEVWEFCRGFISLLRFSDGRS